MYQKGLCEKLNSHKLTYPSTTLYKIQTIYIYTTTRQVIPIYTINNKFIRHII